MPLLLHALIMIFSQPFSASAQAAIAVPAGSVYLLGGADLPHRMPGDISPLTVFFYTIPEATSVSNSQHTISLPHLPLPMVPYRRQQPLLYTGSPVYIRPPGFNLHAFLPNDTTLPALCRPFAMLYPSRPFAARVYIPPAPCPSIHPAGAHCLLI